MRVRVSAAARRDLAGIWRYSAERWDLAQADRYLRLFATAFDSLASGAVKGRAADDIRFGYFKLPIGSHLIFFRNDIREVIDVVRILHQRMDIDRIL